MKNLRYGLTVGILCSSVFIASGAMAGVENSRGRCSEVAPGSFGTVRGTADGTRGRGSVSNSPPRSVGMPLPEVGNSPVAIVTPDNGRVNVKLNNTTNAAITYQVIGHTSPRPLAGKAGETLRGLPLPVTITVVREDGGLLDLLGNNDKFLDDRIVLHPFAI